MPRPCHATTMSYWKQPLKATAQRGMACVNLRRPSRDGMWATCPRSASSGYHAEFHEVCYQKHSNPLTLSLLTSYIYHVPHR
jgi:hypothetical protein